MSSKRKIHEIGAQECGPSGSGFLSMIITETLPLSAPLCSKYSLYQVILDRCFVLGAAPSTVNCLNFAVDVSGGA